MNPIDNLPLNHNNWTLVCPTPHLLHKKDRPQTYLYIRQYQNPIIKPIHSLSMNLAACMVTIYGFTILISSTYNPCKTLLGFESFTDQLCRALLETQLLPVVCASDFNLHSPLWNPLHSEVFAKDTETIISMMA